MESLYSSGTSDTDDEIIPIPSSGCSVSPLGSNVVVIGGWNPHHNDTLFQSHDRGYVRKVYKYNLYSDLWTEHHCYSDPYNCPIETACHCTFPLTTTEILFFGGSLSPLSVAQSSNRVYSYSIKTESWQEIACAGNEEDAPAVQIGHWWGRAAFLKANTLTVCTGNYHSGQLEINQLHMATQPFRWEKIVPVEGAEFPFPLIKHQIVVYDDKVFVFGGSMNFLADTLREDFRGSLASLPTFDLLTKRWSYTHCTFEGDNADIWPFAPSVVLEGDCAFLTGGAIFRDEGSIDLLTDVMRLDLKEKKWNTFSKLKGNGRFFHGSCMTEDGRLCIYGGCLGVEYAICERSNKVEFFQCSVPTLYHCALRTVFSRQVGTGIARRFRYTEGGAKTVIALMKMDGFPEFALKELF